MNDAVAKKEAFYEASANLAHELGQDVEIDRAQLVGLLRAAFEEKEQRDGHSRNYDSLTKLFRTYLDEHPEEELWVEDAGGTIVARYESRSLPGTDVDLTSLRKHDPNLFERLFEMGCLTVNGAVLKAQGGQVSGWKKYEMPKGVTKALKVEREKKGL